MINFKKAQFTISAPSLELKPKDNLPSILIVGRSNVGKSTLINALLGQKIAFSSKKAGKTKLLNYFKIDDTFYLVDTPGYGSTIYANLTTINFAKMMEDYVKEPSLKGILLLVDLRHEPGKDDDAFYKYLRNSGVKIVSVLTKVDTMNQKTRYQALLYAKKYNFDSIIESDLSSKSLEKIKGAILDLLS